MSSSYGLGIDAWVRISPAIALRSTDAPEGTGLVTGVDGNRRLVKWPNGSISWHHIGILEGTVSPFAPQASEQPQETDDADLAAAVWRVGKQMAKISGQFETLMAALAQAAQVLGPVLAVVVEKLESLQSEPETPCMDAFESSDGWYHCNRPDGHDGGHTDGDTRYW